MLARSRDAFASHFELGANLAGALRRVQEAQVRRAKGRALRKLTAQLERTVAAAFVAQGRALVRLLPQVRDRWPTVEALRMRARLDDAGPGAVVGLAEALADADWGPLWREAAAAGDDALEQAIGTAAKAALTEGARSLLLVVAEELLAKYGVSWSLENPTAVSYLAEHGAALVTRIDEATRDDLRRLIAKAMADGRSYDQVADDIMTQFKSYGDPNSYWRFDAARPQQHIASRAHLIAVTEMGNAYEAGEFQAALEMQTAGLTVVKWWSTMGDERVSAGCLENEGDGEIPVDQPHASGDLHPLRFPGCRCTENYDVRVDP